MSAKEIIIGTLILVGGFVFQSQGGFNSLPADAPEDAIEYVELQDGSVTVYDDEIIAEGKNIIGGSISINIEDVSRVKKTGHMLTINGKNGETIQLSMLNPSYAKKLKGTIEELRDEFIEQEGL